MPFSMFVGQDALDAAINDELQPPLAYAELADQDASGPWANVVDPDDQVLPRLQEYETNLEHVNAAIQLRQAKAAKAAQPQVEAGTRSAARRCGGLSRRSAH